MAQYALERRFAAGDEQVEAKSLSYEPRWPVRWRFVFILVAAMLCWAMLAALGYMLIAR